MQSAKLTFESGVLVRHRVRARMDYLGLQWREYKGVFSSHFVVEGEKTKLASLREWLRQKDAGQ